VVRASVDDVAQRLLGKRLCDGRQAAGFVGVVRVQPTDDVSSHSCQALVDGLGLSPIRLGDVAENIRILPAVTLEDLERAICRPTVDHPVLQARVALLEHAPQRPLDVASCCSEGVITEMSGG